VIAQFDAVNEVSESFKKLFKGYTWLLGGPTTAGAFLMTTVIFVAVGASMIPTFWKVITSQGQLPELSPTQVAFMAIGVTIAVIFAIVVSAFTYGWTLVAAEPVWLGREPAFDRGFYRAASKLLTLVAFLLLVAFMSVITLITIVGPIVIGVMTIYGPCFILFKDRSAIEAIGDTFRLASENIGPTIILVLAFVAIYIAGFMTIFIVSLVPLMGLIGIPLQFAFQWLLSAFVALAVVRFYDLLLTGKGSAPPYPLVPENRV